MNSSEMEHPVSSETNRSLDFEEAVGDVTKLVPIGESIRYRRRAQSAEKQAQELADQLTQAHETIAQMSGQVKCLQRDQELTRKLSVAGASDLETALLVAKARTEGHDEIDLDTCVEQLKQEKRHLFESPSGVATLRRTTGAKDRVTQGQAALQQAAAKASRSGRRADLQHYLKLRRALV